MRTKHAVRRVIRIFVDDSDLDWQSNSWTVPILKRPFRRPPLQKCSGVRPHQRGEYWSRLMVLDSRSP